MRQRGSERIRPRAVSHGNGNSNDPTVSTLSCTDQSVDISSQKYSYTDESITVDVPVSSDDAVNAVDTVDTIDAVTARNCLRCLNERRTKSARYHCLTVQQKKVFTLIAILLPFKIVFHQYYILNVFC